MKKYTHEELGIPEQIQVAGLTIKVKFDERLMTATPKTEEQLAKTTTVSEHSKYNFKGDYGQADYQDNVIYLWPGDGKVRFTRQRMHKTFLEELSHFIFYVLHFNPWDFDPKTPIRSNEHFVRSFNEIFIQVLKQLKDFTKALAEEH